MFSYVEILTGCVCVCVQLCGDSDWGVCAAMCSFTEIGFAITCKLSNRLELLNKKKSKIFLKSKRQPPNLKKLLT